MSLLTCPRFDEIANDFADVYVMRPAVCRQRTVPEGRYFGANVDEIGGHA